MALDIREVFDQLRTYHTKNVKPFEKLPEVIDAAIQIIEHDLPAARKELEGLARFIADLRVEMPQVEAEVTQAKARVQTAQESAAAAERTSGETIRAAERLSQSRETELVRDFEHKGATLERDHATRRDELTAEITALEAKKAALDSAIAAVRAKF